MSISKIKENARNALKGKWGKGACIALAYIAVCFAIELVISLFDDSSIVDLVNIASIILQVPIAFGLSYAFIKLKRDEGVRAFDFLNLGFSNFGRAWRIGLREVLKLILPLLGMIFGGILFGTTVIAYIPLVFSGESISMLLIPAIIIYIASTIWFIARSLLYSLTTYIAYDNPDMSALEVVKESEKMMKGNRGKIFLLSLSFFGWLILTVFTFGIGCLWLLPYMIIAEVCFYEYLSDKSENNNSDAEVEAIREL